MDLDLEAQQLRLEQEILNLSLEHLQELAEHLKVPCEDDGKLKLWKKIQRKVEEVIESSEDKQSVIEDITKFTKEIDATQGVSEYNKAKQELENMQENFKKMMDESAETDLPQDNQVTQQDHLSQEDVVSHDQAQILEETQPQLDTEDEPDTELEAFTPTEPQGRPVRERRPPQTLTYNTLGTPTTNWYHANGIAAYPYYGGTYHYPVHVPVGAFISPTVLSTAQIPQAYNQHVHPWEVYRQQLNGCNTYNPLYQ